MMMPDSNFEKIELYILGELSSGDKEKFEEQLRKDDALKKQYQIYKETDEILSKKIQMTDEEKALISTLERKKQKYFNQRSKVVPLIIRRRKIWLSVTSIAAAAILVLLLWGPWQKGVLNDYGQIQMTNPTVRGDEHNQEMGKVARLFNRESYKEVLSLLDSVVQHHPDNAQSLFYRGVTLLHLKKEAKARKDLKAVYEGQSVYRYQAAYFMGLSYLQNNQKDSCRSWLQKIPEEAAISDKAQRILRKIGE